MRKTSTFGRSQTSQSRKSYYTSEMSGYQSGLSDRTDSSYYQRSRSDLSDSFAHSRRLQTGKNSDRSQFMNQVSSESLIDTNRSVSVVSQTGVSGSGRLSSRMKCVKGAVKIQSDSAHRQLSSSQNTNWQKNCGSKAKPNCRSPVTGSPKLIAKSSRDSLLPRCWWVE